MSTVLGAAAACTPRVALGARAAATARWLPSASFRGAPSTTRVITRFSCARVSRRTTVCSASTGDSPDLPGDTSSEPPEEDDAENILGDSFVQEEITSQLKYQTKLYQAQQFLEDKKAEFLDKGESGKSQMDTEAALARDRASLELGMRASEIDDQLAEMLDETAAARARNEKVQAELADLEEVSAVDARMRKTLEETQRKSAFTLILLLLVVTDVSLVAEYAWDKAFAVTAVIGLVGYQAKNENDQRRDQR
jgi:hypothetical protein